MTTVEIHERTFQFACRIVRLHRELVRGRGNRIAADQLLRSGTSVGANLQEADAAQSRADFLCRMRIALKEARETYYWLRLVEATEMMPSVRVAPLRAEANEIVAVITAIVRNTIGAKKERQDSAKAASGA